LEDIFLKFGVIGPIRQIYSYVYVVSRKDIKAFIANHSSFDHKTTSSLLERYFPKTISKQKRKETKLNCINEEDAETHRDIFSNSMICYLNTYAPSADRLAARERIFTYLCKAKILKTEFAQQCHDFFYVSRAYH